MTKETGGTAFPVQSIYCEDQETNSRGMTLRDYFAAKAMQSCLTENTIRFIEAQQIEISNVAARSYEMADAMLKAREQ